MVENDGAVGQGLTNNDAPPHLVVRRGGLVMSDTPKGCQGQSHAAMQSLEAARLRWMAAHDERWNGGRCRDRLMADAADLDHEASMPIQFRSPTETAGGELPLSVAEDDPVADGRDRGMIETVRQPTLVKASADLMRLRRAEETGSLELALDLGTELRAKSNLERMLIQALSAAYSGANRLQAAAMHHVANGGGHDQHRDNEYRTRSMLFDAMQAHNTEAAKLSNAATRQWQTFFIGVQTLAHLRRGGRQKITVVHQHVTVKDGGQAVIAHNVKGRGGPPRAREGQGRQSKKTRQTP